MTDETAKLLAQAINNLAVAINRIPVSNGLMGGINVVHHGIPSMYQQSYYPQPGTCGGGTGAQGQS